MSALNWVYLRLACTCEETCLSVWPSNASLYANSTCRYLRLLASPFGQGFIIANKCSSTHTYNSETRRAVVLPIIVRLQNSSGSHSFDYCATETSVPGSCFNDYCTTRKLVGELFYRLLYDSKTRWGVICSIIVRRKLQCRGVVLPTTIRLGNSLGSCFTGYCTTPKLVEELSVRLLCDGNLSGSCFTDFCRTRKLVWELFYRLLLRIALRLGNSLFYPL